MHVLRQAFRDTWNASRRLSSLSLMSSSSTPSSPPARRPWRLVLLWTAFAATLVAGLTLAVLHGNEAPILLDVISQ
jgi:hypothetical protein